jgi:hypothetical protein
MDESVLWSWRLLSPIRGGSEPHCSGVVREFRLMPNRIIDRCLVLDTLESTRGGGSSTPTSARPSVQAMGKERGPGTGT